MPTLTTVQVVSDSSVLVAQLGAQAAAPIVRLAPLFAEARRVLKQFAQVDLQWVPRHRNGVADTLARAALGLASKVATPSGQIIKKRKRR